MRRTLAVVCLTTVLTCGASGAAWAALPDAPPYGTCAAASADGRVNILRGEVGYAAQLDGDDDGVACERGDPAASNGGAGQGSGDTGVNADDESTGGQVAIVPQGAAPTGDGSTASSSHSWWVGSLLTALAGVGVRRRRAVAGR